MTSSRSRLALALFLFTTTACSGGGGGGGGGGNPGTASLSGRLRLPEASGPVAEVEPNDTLGGAQLLGAISAGQSLTITGVTQAAPADTDVFSLVAQQRVRITATITHDAANDFDLAVFDPVGLQVVEFFGATTTPETGTFVARGAFDLVVSPFAGAGSYTLTLTAEPSNPTLENEPNDTPSFSNYLGELTLGSTITLQGTLADTTDTNDVFTIACPERIDMNFLLTSPGNDYDLEILDASADVTNPTSIVVFDSAFDPEQGFLTVPAFRLIAVDVSAFSGSGSYELTISATSPTSRRPAGGPLALDAIGDALVPLEREHPRDRRVASGGEARPIGVAAWDARPGELIVQPHEDCDTDGLLARRQCQLVTRVPDGPMLLRFELAPGLSPEDRGRATLAFARAMNAADDVLFAEPNYMLQATATEPDDTHYDKQWHYPLIQLPAAWDVTQGDAGLVTAVIDTGGIAHPDLDGREVAGFDFISDPQIANDGDGIDNDPTDVGDGGGLNPSSFHGSHVGGTIGAESDNGFGVSGVTWFGGIMHLRTLGVGGGTTFDILNAILYAARLPNSSGTLPAQRADVINMSLGGGGFSQASQDAVTDAFNAGCVVIAAAGNENSSTPSFPAAYDNVISVAAVDQQAARSPYSNFHPTVDIAAPGGNTGADLDGDGFVDGVLSTIADDSQGAPEFAYSFLQGTSMAAPHVAGVAGLMLAANPALTPAQVESILISTASDLGAPGKDDLYGHGLVDAFRAVTQASGGAMGSPVLGLSTASVAFGANQTSLDVQVSNLGGGVLDVGTLTATTDSGGPWLTATANAVGTPVTTDTSSLTLTVNRTGLADGAYVGNVQVDSNGGTSNVQVTLLVSTAPPATSNIPIFVLAADPLTGFADFVVAVDPGTSLDFALNDLPPGEYLIAAGSDVDEDGVICDEDEPYCGFFPTYDRPLILTVEEGNDLTGLDFSVAAPVSIFSTTERPILRYR